MALEEQKANRLQCGAGTRLSHAHIALDTTAHSTLVIENLHHFLSPGHVACSFLYVMPFIQSTGNAELRAAQEEALQELERIVNERFDQYASTLAEHGVVVESRHLIREAEGIEEGILRYAEPQKQDLLVLGMHDFRPRRERWQISSTSYSIATHAPGSVLILKYPAVKGECLKVLFATDGSGYADKAALQLIRFLPKENSEIVVFSAVAVNYYTLPLVEPYVDYVPLERALQGEAVEILERARNLFRQAGYRVTNAYFGIGDPVEQILQEADRQEIDLIVTGSHGAGRGPGFTGRFLGSVSSRILECSTTSVAILRQAPSG